MRFISISKQNIEDAIKKVEKASKAVVEDWRLEILADVDAYNGTASTDIEFVAVLNDGINFTTKVEMFVSDPAPTNPPPPQTTSPPPKARPRSSE